MDPNFCGGQTDSNTESRPGEFRGGGRISVRQLGGGWVGLKKGLGCMVGRGPLGVRGPANRKEFMWLEMTRGAFSHENTKKNIYVDDRSRTIETLEIWDRKEE